MSTRKFLAAAIAFAYLGCGSGEKTTGPQVAASIEATSTTTLTGVIGTPVTPAPSVLVKDQNNAPVAGAAVTFTVTGGGGTVTGATATTDAQGIATVGSWVLGTSVGTNTLTAASGTLSPVTFVAVALTPQCAARSTHSFGTTTNGALAVSDCQFNDGTFVDFYTTTLAQANAYLFSESATFDTYLILGSQDGAPIGENDDADSNTTNSAVKALLPPGTYLLGPGSFAANIFGDYSLTSSTAATNVGNCERVFVVKGVSTNQNIEATDCLWTQPPSAIYADKFIIFLRAGDKITLTMTSSAVDSYLELRRCSSGSSVDFCLSAVGVASNDNKDSTTKDAQITFTAATSDYYAIFTHTALASQVGPYTLSVQ